jgi:hypothetical protein
MGLCASGSSTLLPIARTESRAMKSLMSSMPMIQGPANPNTVSVLIKHANKELAAQGWHIAPAWLGRGARYRLERITP